MEEENTSVVVFKLSCLCARRESHTLSYTFIGICFLYERHYVV